MKKAEKKASRERIYRIAIPAALVIFGILMIVNPNLMRWIFLVISILLLLAALVELVIYYAVLPYEKKPAHQRRGILLGICGAVMLLIYLLIAALIPFCIGAGLCAVGAFGMRRDFAGKTAGQPWQIPLITDALILVMGIVILICTFFTNWIWTLTGVLMVIGGLLRMVNVFLTMNASEAIPEKPYVDVEATIHTDTE